MQPPGRLSSNLLLLGHSVMSDSLWPHGLQHARLLCPWIFPGKNTEWVAISFSRNLPNPGIEPLSPVSPVLVGRFFTTEPPKSSYPKPIEWAFPLPVSLPQSSLLFLGISLQNKWEARLVLLCFPEIVFKKKKLKACGNTAWSRSTGTIYFNSIC